MIQQSEEKEVVVVLSRAEALVLFEWLASNDGSLPFQHPSEQDVLWRIEGALELVLEEALSPDYSSCLSAAREAVRSSTGPRE